MVNISYKQAPATPTTTGAATGNEKICGAWFSTTATAQLDNTICSCSIPFRVGVHFDGDENIITVATTTFDHNEAAGRVGHGNFGNKLIETSLIKRSLIWWLLYS